MTVTVTEEAHAKLNLTLEVLGKRSDGYHDIASIITTIDLHDTVTVEPADGIQVSCDDPSLSGEANLAFKAGAMMESIAGPRYGARIGIVKRIPVAAGLGGGSADAAAALRGLNRLWGLGLSTVDLARVGADVGSDVPFLVHSGTALISGRGELVEPVPTPEIGQFILLCPGTPIQDKTRTLFELVTPDLYTRGSLSRKLAARIRSKGDVPAELMFNVFNDIAPKAFPEWAGHRASLANLGAREIMLAGAGPSMFAKIPAKELGTAWQLLLNERQGSRAFIVRAWNPTPAGRS